MFKKISRLKRNNITKTSSMVRTSRLKRVVFAEWEQVNSMDYIEELTDAMTYNFPVQINYQGSGWRTIQPYGWNTSKDGNINLMCYKETGEVRSYSINKIEDVYIDKDSNIAITNNPEMNSDNDLDSLLNIQNNDTIIYNETFDNDSQYPDDMPMLPEMNTETYSDQPGVYDEELALLSQDNIEENVDYEQENEEFVNNQELEENEENSMEEYNNGENGI